MPNRLYVSGVIRQWQPSPLSRSERIPSAEGFNVFCMAHDQKNVVQLNHVAGGRIEDHFLVRILDGDDKQLVNSMSFAAADVDAHERAFCWDVKFVEFDIELGVGHEVEQIGGRRFRDRSNHLVGADNGRHDDAVRACLAQLLFGRTVFRAGDDQDFTVLLSGRQSNEDIFRVVGNR